MPKITLNEIVADTARRASLEDRFWPKVDRKGDDECWDWNAKSRKAAGYGIINGGKDVGTLRANRVVYALKQGFIPDDLTVRHTCDNASCCNPSHLIIGTQRDNIRDAVERGRLVYPKTKRGAQVSSAKLTDEKALAIKRDDRPATAVARDYGIHICTVYALRWGKIWKHLNESELCQ